MTGIPVYTMAFRVRSTTRGLGTGPRTDRSSDLRAALVALAIERGLRVELDPDDTGRFEVGSQDRAAVEAFGVEVQLRLMRGKGET